MFSDNTVWHHVSVTKSKREDLMGHRSGLIWFTGLSGSGKSTIAHAVEEKLFRMGCHTYVFDGDNVRHGLCGDLGFSRKDRTENIRRIGEMVKLFLDAGIIALTAFISPFRGDRRRVKQLIGSENYVEVYCRCPIEICEGRDKKRLYQRAIEGKIKEFTGISSPYEEPESPDLILATDKMTINECVDRIVVLLSKQGLIQVDRGKNSVSLRR